MKIVRNLTTLGGLLAATLALAQPPAPPAGPTPAAAPAPPAAPARPARPSPALAPTPRAEPLPFAFDGPALDSDAIDRIEEQAQRAAERAAEIQLRMPDIEERTQAAMARADSKMRLVAPDGPLLFQKVGARRFGSEDNLYDAGKRALDNHRWDEALEDFNQVAARAGSRADAAWYFKAYTLNKLGRRDEAVAALAELRKSYPQSHWLEDAKYLALEIQQAAGKPVSPNDQSDEDLKLIAINSIMQSDPDRAIPLIENLLKTSTSPKLKERAVFVLAQSGAPRARQVLESIARGGGNPDLQVKAIEYMRQSRRQNDINPNLLPEIYGSTNDTAVKRAILNTYASNHEYDHLLQAARAEKNHDLYLYAIARLGENTGQPELWQLYASASPDDKAQIVEYMYNNPNLDKLAEVLHTEKDPKVRAAAIRVLAQQKAATAETLVSAYSSEQDEKIRMTIVDSLYSQRNAKALVELARAEKDPKMKVKIVDRLGNMKSKEASDYLMEILSK